MRIISLGWGCQSFALAAMSALGVLPPVDAVVHADTGHERAETYALAEKWTPWLEKHGVRVVTVHGGRPLMGTLPGGGSYTSIPCFTARSEDVWTEGGDWIDGEDGKEYWQPDGSRILAHRKGEPSGMFRRQCTGDWKIDPIRRWCSAELKQRGLKKTPGVIEKWLGITFDEARRIKPNDVKYVKLIYPFIEMFDRPMKRNDVIRWLTENSLEIPVKSTCVFCPYHDCTTWREIQLSNNGDWEKALDADRAIRNKRPGYLCYLTAQRKPLDECDFRNQEDHGQLALWHTDDDSMSAADGEHLPLARQPEAPG